MNAEQFKLLIDTMNKYQQTFLEQLAQQSRSHQDLRTPIQNLCHISPFEQFDNKKENFKFYIQRFENYLKMKDIFGDKEKCRQILLSSLGAPVYNTLAALVAPKTTDDFNYEELIKILQQHLAPTRNVLVAQHYFLSTYQNDNETISDYVASLKRNLPDCNFSIECSCKNKVSAADLFLRAQFIRGISDDNIREKILESDAGTLNDIITKAVAFEASKANSRELANSQPFSINYTDDQELKSIRNDSCKNNRNQCRRLKPKDRVDLKSLGLYNHCLRCGRTNHLAKDCRETVITM